MENIANLISDFEIKKPAHKGTTERSDALHFFYERLVAEYKEYKGSKYNDKDFKSILAIRTAKAGYKSISQLRMLYGSCNHSRNFAKTFWWKLRNPQENTCIKNTDAL